MIKLDYCLAIELYRLAGLPLPERYFKYRKRKAKRRVQPRRPKKN